MKRIICCIKAIPFFLKSGIWCPHIYKEYSKENAIIISTDSSFRVSDSYLHANCETVHPKATLIKNRCICCGKEDWSWFDREPYIICQYG